MTGANSVCLCVWACMCVCEWCGVVVCCVLAPHEAVSALVLGVLNAAVGCIRGSCTFVLLTKKTKKKKKTKNRPRSSQEEKEKDDESKKR